MNRSEIKTQKGNLPASSANVYNYIVANAAKDVNLRKKVVSLISEQGLPSANILEAPARLSQAVLKSGEVNKKLYELHPDKELIINEFIKEKGLLENDKTYDACACGMAADGDGLENDKGGSDDKLKMANTMLIAGVTISLVSIIGLMVVATR